MTKILAAVVLVGICFMLYLVTLELRDMNKEIKDLKSSIDTNVNVSENQNGTVLGEINSTQKTMENMYSHIGRRLLVIEGGISKIRIEQQRSMDKSVFDNDFVDIEQLKKEVKEEYDEEN